MTACPRCGDHGELIVPLGRDEFGNFDTDSRPCSCAAGDVVAERLAAARAWHAARNQPFATTEPVGFHGPAAWRPRHDGREPAVSGGRFTRCRLASKG